jgi:hypothetical protein
MLIMRRIKVGARGLEPPNLTDVKKEDLNFDTPHFFFVLTIILNFCQKVNSLLVFQHSHLSFLFSGIMFLHGIILSIFYPFFCLIFGVHLSFAFSTDCFCHRPELAPKNCPLVASIGWQARQSF